MADFEHDFTLEDGTVLKVRENFADVAARYKTFHTPARDRAFLNQNLAFDRSPEEEAEIYNLSRKTGWTPAIVREQKTLAKEQSQKVNVDALSPALVNFIAKTPDNFALIKDDIPQLQKTTGLLERIQNFGGDLADDVSTAFETGELNTELGHLYYSKFIDGNAANDIRIQQLEEAIAIPSEQETVLGKIATATAEQLPLLGATIGKGLEGAAKGMIAGGALGLVGGPATAVPGILLGAKAGFAFGSAQEIFVLEAGHAAGEYSEFVDEDGKKLDPETVKYAAMTAGFLNAGLEFVGHVAMLKTIPGLNRLATVGARKVVKDALKKKSFRSAIKRIALAFGGALAIEPITEMAQEAVTIDIGEVTKRLKLPKAEEIEAQTKTERILHAGGQAFFAVTGIGGGGSLISVSAAALQRGSRAIKARSIKERPKQFYNDQVEISEDLDQTKVKNLAPEKLQELLEDTGMTQDVLVDGREAHDFYQVGDNSKIFTKLGLTQEDVLEAARSGKSIPLKLSEIHTILSHEESKKFFQIVKETSESLSLKDSREINIAEELSRVNEILEEVNREETEFFEEKKRIRNEILEVAKIRKIKNAKTYAEGVAEIWGAFSRRMSIEADQSPAATLKRIRTEVATFHDIKEAEQAIEAGGLKNTVPLGVTRVFPEGYIIKLFEKANHSTLLHETGHVFLSEVEALINLDKASEALINDFKTAKDWLKVDPKKGITVKQQDNFARAFELYLREGKPPVKGLTEIFERFKQWQTTVYQKVKGSPIDVNLNDDVRAVFDRLLAVEQEVDQFVEQNEFVLPDSLLDKLDLSKEDKLLFRRLMQGMTVTAKRQLQQKLAREHKSNIKTWKKDAEIEVAGRRVNNVFSELTSTRRGFDLSSSSQFLSAKELNSLDKKFPDIFVGEGMDPKTVTDRFGYESVDKMFEDLEKTPSLETQIENIKNEERKQLKKAKERRNKGIEAIRFRREKQLEKTTDKDERIHIRKEAQKEINELRLASDREITNIKNKSLEKQEAEKSAQINQLRDFLKNPIWGLNQDEIEVQFGKQTAIKLKAKNSKLVRSKGQSVSPVALEYGYDSITEMIDDLISRPPRLEQVNDLIRQKEREHYLNFTSSDALLNWNDDIEKYFKTIGDFLNKRAGIELSISTKEYRNDIERGFAVLTVRRATRTDWHLSDMRKALRNRDKAIRKGEFKEAVGFHHQARINYEFARKSNQIRRDTDKLKNLVKSSFKAKGKIEFDYWKNIVSLGNKFALRTGKEPQNVVPFQNLLDKQQSLIDSGVKFRPWIESVQPKSFRDLNVSQFEELKILIEVLDHIGRKIVKDETVLSDIKFSELKTRIIERIKTLPRKADWDSRSRFGKMDSFGKDFFSDINALHTICVNLDGFTELGPKGETGPITEALYDKGIKADSDYLKINADIVEKIKPALNQLNKSFIKYPKIISEITVPVPELLKLHNRNWYFDTVVGIALNMGNRQNIEAVKEGYGLSESDLLNILAPLTREDWDAIQSISDAIGGYREELFAVKKRMNGFEPPIVEPDVYVTGEGQKLRGWYYPLVTDYDLMTGKINLDVEENFRETINAAVPANFTIERKGFGGRPVKLDLSALAQHIHGLALYISHAEYVKDAGRILTDPEISKLIIEKLGLPALKSAQRSLRNIAHNKYEEMLTMDKMFEQMRRLSTIYILGLNLAVALKQFFSTPAWWSEYGFGTWVKGVGMVLRANLTLNTKDLIKNMYALSPYMKNRGSSIDVSIHEAIQRDLLQLPVPFFFGVKKSQIQEAMFVAIKTADFMTVIPQWMGAFEKGKKEFNGDIDKAVLFADKSIRTTQPSFRPIDLSPLQDSRKGISRMVTMFSTMTLIIGRRQRTQLKALRQGKMSLKDFARADILENWLAPILMNFMFAAFRGDIPDPEDLFWDLFAYRLIGIPVVKDLVVVLSNIARGKKYGRNWDSPLFTPFELGAQMANLITRLVKDLDNDKKWKDAVLAIAELFSFVKGVPAPKLGRKTIKGMEQWERGEGTPINILIPQTPTKK
jgi:hypothetical protein